MFRTKANRILSLSLTIILWVLTFTRPVYSAPFGASEDKKALSIPIPPDEDSGSANDAAIGTISLEPDRAEGTGEGASKRSDEGSAISIDDLIFAKPDEQILSTATLDDEFADDTVTVILTKEASRNNKDFTAHDFGDIGVAEVKDLVRLSDGECSYVEQVWAAQDFVGTMVKRDKEDKNAAEDHLSFETHEAIRQYEDARQIVEENTLVNVDEFRRILLIRLAEPGKANVLRAIRQLERRADIYYVGPSYIIKESVIESTAQTFINNIADGSTPGSSAQAFTGTSVTDLGSIDPNWR